MPLLLLAAVLFLGFGSRTISAPFGDSHDGKNGKVWSAGSRSLREEGPVASRLGTRNPVTGVYANHPPLIYLETAVTELVGFGTMAATRAPAWLGTLALIGLLGALLRDSGLRPNAVGMAVLLVTTTPMLLVYGTMLDTPVTSLPIAVGLLLMWERARRGKVVRPVYAGGLTALAVLAGWQALLLAGLVGSWALVRVVRRTGRRKVDRAFVIGACLGGALLLAWMLWAFGGTLRPLQDQFSFRSGQSAQKVGLGELLASQRHYGVGMFGAVGVLGVVGLVLALRDARTRGLAAVASAVTVPYTVVLRTGAVNHSYWGYWFLLPIAIGLAVGSDRLLATWRSRGRWQPVLPCVVALLATVLVVGAWVRPPAAESNKIAGYKVAQGEEGAAPGPR